MVKAKESITKGRSLERLKPHHAKPFRKRHYGLLVVSLISATALIYIFSSTSLANYRAVKSAKDLISSFLSTSTTDEPSISSAINSSYGFSLSYSPAVLNASAVDSRDGGLYVGSELAAARDYSAIKVSSFGSDPAQSAASGSLTVEYHTESPVGASADLAKLEARFVGAKNPGFSITSSGDTTISGKGFLRSTWSAKDSSEMNSGLQPKLTSYTAVLNDVPFVIVMNSGLAQSKELESAFTDTLNSLQFQMPQPISFAGDQNFTEQVDDLGLLDRLMMTTQTNAAAPTQPNSAERTSLMYGPAVVKIYNIYCMDIDLGNQEFLSDSCGGSTGSGFFVGNGGYVATNGHVAVNSPLDIAIIYAFDQATKGNPIYFSALAEASGLTQAELDAGSTNQEKLRISVNKFYQIPDSALRATNKTENILVGLGEKQPDIQSLLTMTKNGQVYVEEDTLKQAKLVAYNYRAVDGADTGTFEASDVALLKVSGSEYPSTKLGAITSLSQGSGLSIIGYPGAASSNQLVESTESRATLTSGKVSSIKSAAGSTSQLIETDATIGHGNSGGPAFNDSGEVVGIATYTIDGSGDGNGVFNYVRDIADFTTLATDNSIDISVASETQQRWQDGIEYFYKAHYSKAIKEFSAVKALYPQHPKVDQLSALAQQKIDAGEEAEDFPLLLTGVALSVSILLLGLSLFLIIRHHKRHLAYKDYKPLGPESSFSTATHTQTSPPTQTPNPPNSYPTGA